MNRLSRVLMTVTGVLTLVAGLMMTGAAVQAAIVNYSVDLSGVDTLVTGQEIGSVNTAMSADGKKVVAGWATVGGAQKRAYVAVGSVSGSSVTWGAPVEVAGPADEIADVQLVLNQTGSRVFTAVGADNDAVLGLADVSGNSVQNLQSTQVEVHASETVQSLKAVISQDFTLGTVLGLVTGAVRTFSFGANSSNMIFASNASSALSSSAQQIGLVHNSAGTKATAVFSTGANVQLRALKVTPGSPIPSVNFGERDTLFVGDTNVDVAASSNGDATLAWVLDGEAQVVSTVFGGSDVEAGTIQRVSQPGVASYRTPSISRSADGKTALLTWTSGTTGEKDEVLGATATVSGSTASWASPQHISGDGYSQTQSSVLSGDGKSGIAVYLIGNTPPNRRLHVRPVSVEGKTSKWGTSAALTEGSSNVAQTAAMSSTDGVSMVWRSGSSGNTPVHAQVGLLKSPVKPAGKKSQVPTNNCVVVPKKLPLKGARVLMKPNCTTNARQKVKLKVNAKLRQRGEITFYRVYRVKSGKFKGQTRIKTYGYKIKANIKWSAPAKGVYRAYNKSVSRSN